MIKIPITYEDFDGNMVTEDHYFHLSKSELIKLESETDGGETISAKFERVGKSGDGGLIMKTFKELIALAYGQRVDGSGSQFYKNQELTERFLGSLAFDQMLEDLLTNVTDAISFVNGIMPKGLNELAAKISQQPVTDAATPRLEEDVKKSGLNNPYDSDGKLLAWAFREPHHSETTNMNATQLRDVYRRKNDGWNPPVSALSEGAGALRRSATSKRSHPSL